MSAGGEADFQPAGLLLVLTSMAMEACRLTLVQKLLQVSG